MKIPRQECSALRQPLVRLRTLLAAQAVLTLETTREEKLRKELTGFMAARNSLYQRHFVALPRLPLREEARPGIWCVLQKSLTRRKLEMLYNISSPWPVDEFT